jgi:hypothetical protein
MIVKTIQAISILAIFVVKDTVLAGIMGSKATNRKSGKLSK